MLSRARYWIAGALVAGYLAYGPAIGQDAEKLTGEQRAALTAEAKRLWKEAQGLDQEGKIKEAVAAAEKKLAADRRLFGNDHEDVAFDLEWLAERYEQQEDFATARRNREEALANKSKRLGQDHRQTIDARLALLNVDLLARLTAEQRASLREADGLLSQVSSLDGQGKYAQAVPLAEKVLMLRQSILGDQHRYVGDAANWLAREYKYSGDYARAEPLYRQALEIRKKALGETHPHYATSLNNLAGLYESMGDYARAEPLYRQATEIRKNAQGETHPDYATNLNNLAELYSSMGDYARAEPLYRQATEIRKKALGETHPHYAASLNNLAFLYSSIGDYARAEPLYRQALEIRKKALGETHPHYAASLNNLAFLYSSMGDYARAEPLYRQATEIRKKALGKTHPAYATSLNNLAGLYSSMGDYARAEPLFRQALEIRKKALGETHPAYATSLNNLAGLYSSMGDYARAEPLFRQALEIRKKALGETHPDYAQSLNNLAGLYESMGDYARAEPLYRQALAISRRNLDLAAIVQSERQQLAMLGDLRHRLDNLVALASRAREHGAAAYDEVLSWKGLVLGRQQQTRAALAQRPELTPIWEELRSVAGKLATLSMRAPASEQAGAWQAKIGELSRQKEMLEARLAAASREYRDALAPVKLADIQAALPDGAALIDFLQFWYSDAKPKEQGGGRKWERRLAAFIVRREAPVELVDLGASKAIEDAIEAWRSGMGRTPESQAAAQTLREKLWLPIETHLAGLTTALISPDGELGKLPFAALPGRAPGSFLLEDYTLAVIPAPHVVVDATRTAAQHSPAGNMLVVAGVDYNGRSTLPPATPQVATTDDFRAVRDNSAQPFPELPGTKGELAMIEKLYRDRRNGNAEGLKRLAGGAATRDAVIREAPGYRYLHLATHGYFAAERFKSALERSAHDLKGGKLELVSNQSLAGYHPGLLSGLALAGANKPDETDDGILTAEEVGSLNLSGIKLVVLSACETGLGKSAGGEGLLGLQRAFQAAGAKTVIASLWKVDDVATRDLMERFYDNLWNKNMGKLEALREAQLWTLKERGPRGLTRIEGDSEQRTANNNRLPPYYWAAWVLSGDWR